MKYNLKLSRYLIEAQENESPGKDGRGGTHGTVLPAGTATPHPLTLGPTPQSPFTILLTKAITGNFRQQTPLCCLASVFGKLSVHLYTYAYQSINQHFIVTQNFFVNSFKHLLF